MPPAIAFVTFEGFYAQSLLKANPAWAGKPIVVLKARRVLDASAEARQAGIQPGMTAQEARYAARALQKTAQAVFHQFKQEQYTADSHRWLDICKQYAGAIEPIEPHQAFLNLDQLAGARQIIQQLKTELQAATKLKPQIGIAQTMLAARIAAENNAIINEGEDAQYLHPLPIEKLWPADPSVIQRLRYLGYRTIGEVAHLPLDILRKQFGQQGDQLHEWCQGKDHRVVKPLYPPSELFAAFHFPQPARLEQEIEPALHKIAQTLALRLSSLDKQCLEIQLTITFDENNSRVITREFLHPMQSTGSLLTGLRLTLKRITIDQDVHSIHAAALRIAQADKKQHDLLNISKQTHLAEMVSKRLQTSFGEKAIKKAAEIEIPRRKLLLRAWRQAAKWNR